MNASASSAPNGAGKSTLLKIVSGLIKPDSGQISINGTVGAMIELSAGFNPLLTGRENIYLNAALLGFSKKEIRKKFDTIVAFSELGDYLDMPVLNYSSGMRIRLGFSIAIQMEPDLLIIDEVLAVGDAEFKNKCYDALEKRMDNMAVILISHNMLQIDRLANKIIVLKNGKIAFQSSDVNQGIQLYNNFAPELTKKTIENEIVITQFTNTFSNQTLLINLLLKASEDIQSTYVEINIVTAAFLRVATVRSEQISFSSHESKHIQCEISDLTLSPNTYLFTINIWRKTKHKKNSLVSRYKGLEGFTVEGAVLPHEAVFYPKHRFTYEPKN